MYANSVNEMPSSRRVFTDSFASMQLLLVAHGRRTGPREIQEALQLLSNPLGVGFDHHHVRQGSFRRAPTWVADQSRSAAHQRHRPVTGTLKVNQSHDGNKAPDVQAVGRRIKPAVAR